jgi:hypothetical protein
VLAPGAGDGVGFLKGGLETHCARAGEKHWVKCWYDQEQDEIDLPNMIKGVDNSENLLLFLTKKALTSTYVQKEVKHAMKQGKNIIIVHETDTSKGRARFVHFVVLFHIHHPKP